MFCPKCGAELFKDASFCTKCGANVLDVVKPDDGRGTSEHTDMLYQIVTEHPAESSGRQEALDSLDVTAIAPAAGQAGAPAPLRVDAVSDSQSTGRSRKALVIGIIILAVAMLAAGIAFGVRAWQEQEENHKAHEPVLVSLQLGLEGYESGSGAPVKVTGTDLDGRKVAEVHVLQPDAAQFQVLRGTYELKAGGTPVSDDGKLYSAPKGALKFVADEHGASFGEDAPVLEYKAVAVEDVTDKQIKAAEKWQKAQGASQSQVDARSAAVKEAREVRQRQIAAQEAAREKERKAKEEAEAKKKAEKAKADALAANPASIQVPAAGTKVTLTGTLDRVYVSHDENGMGYDQLWYVLKTPKGIALTGTTSRATMKRFAVANTESYTAMPGYAESYLSLPDWEELLGSVVTVEGTLSELPPTAHNYDAFGFTSAKIKKSY